jgi:exopolysaccharide production protein ExoZ
MVVGQHSLNRGPGLPTVDHGIGFLSSGAEVFFILSGYVIVRSQEHKLGTARYFAERFLRIVPLYWFYLTAFILIYAVVGRTADMPLHNIVQSYLFIPHYSATIPGRIYPVLVPGWTLNYEMFFYGLFGVAMLMRHRLVCISSILIALVAVGMIFGPVDAVLKTYTNKILLLFLAGVLIAAWSQRMDISRSLWPLLPLGFVGLVASDLYTQVDGLFRWGIPAIMIIVGALATEGRRTLPFLASLGNASYSIYLSHIVTMLFVRAAWKAIHPQIFLSEPIFIILLLASSVLVGLLSYRFIELPLLRSGRRLVGAVNERNRASRRERLIS